MTRASGISAKCRVVTRKPVRISKNAKEMLRFDVDNENETIRNYRERIPQCESLDEYCHQIDLATALVIGVPDLGGGPKGRTPGKRR